MVDENTDFGEYTRHRKLGKGGMAWVYLATQKSFGRPVALKVLFPHLAEDEAIAARFESEARTSGMMQHPNIVQAIDYGRVDGQPFIAFEYIDGWDLAKWLRERREHEGDPPVEIALLILRDLCRALEHAHAPERNVVHRDIKPSNAMLSRDGVVKLTDFGLAKALDEDLGRTQTGQRLGTWAYMSTEQAAGRVLEGDAAKLSDIFSMGIVCYELLGGVRPFQGADEVEIARAIQEYDPPALVTISPLVPPEVSEIVGHMLAKSPHHRTQRIATVAEVLEEAIDRIGIRRDRQLMREYAQAPAETKERLRAASLSRHMQQGHYFQNRGEAGQLDALREYRCARFLDPDNPIAVERVKLLESVIRSRKEVETRHGNASAAEEDPTVPLPPVPPDPVPPPPPPPPPRRPPVAAIVASLVALGALAGLLAWHPWRRAPEPVSEMGSRPDTVATRDTARAREPIVTRDTTSTPHEVAPVTRDTTGGIQIQALDPPRALVAIDGGPPGHRMRFAHLRPGPHTLVASAPGYVSRTQALPVASGREIPITIRLERESAPTPAQGALVLSVAPAEARVRIDHGSPTTSRRFDALAAGDHDVVVEADGYTSVDRTAHVVAAGTATLDVALARVPGPPRLGRLKVVTLTDFWGQVWVDGVERPERTGGTLTLAEGNHRVGVRHAGFHAVEGEIVVKVVAGETATAGFTILRDE